MAFPAPALCERQDELGELAAVVARLRAGHGGVVVVEGPQGIGKTRLLAAAREEALRAGVRALAARASELESQLSFGVVRQLLEPVVLGADAELMFEGAAAGAQSIFSGGSDGEEGADIFRKLHGLYWLLATLARDRPLALIVDDAQWADPPSLHFLAFLARRTPELPVAALIATRPIAEAGDPLLTRVATDAAAHLVRPRPLSRDGVRDLALEVLAPEPSPAFVAACHDAALGNPFLVTELLREVAARAVAPTEAGAQLVGELAPRGVAAMVMLRLDGVPASCRALIEAVAVLGDRVSTREAASLADLTADEAEDAATRLFRAGLLDHDGGLAFTHPVVRTAVEQSIAPVRRSAAHRRAAALLAERGASDEEIAAHVLASEPAGSADAVALLRRAAARAVALGAPESAITYLRRALAEPPTHEERPVVMLELGRAEARAGHAEAGADLRRAIELAPDAGARSLAALELARAVKYGGGSAAALPVLENCLAETVDPVVAELLEVEILGMAHVSAETRVHLAGRLAALSEPPAGARGPLAGMTLAALAFDGGRSGRSADEAARLAARVPATLDAGDPAADFSLLIAIVASLWADRFEQAERLSSLLMQEARRSGAALPLTAAVSIRAWVHQRRGELADAESDARFAIELTREIYGIETLVSLALSTAALTAIEREAPPDEVDELLAALGRDDPDTLPHDTMVHARGCVLVARGELEAGLEELLAAGRRHQRWLALNPSMLAWRSDAALVLHALGDVLEARRLAEEELSLARRFGAPRALGIALRAHALVGERERVLDGLAEAVAVLEGSTARLELARALVDLGAAMRRAGERVAAREPLRRGAELAVRSGARRVARQAHEELLASGARPRRLALRGVEALTPSERRVAALAATGRTNRQIAQELFVSEKTVEGHLARVYDKLEVRSRAALPQALETGTAA